MASRDPRVTDAAAFDQLRLDLIDAGFEPVEGSTDYWEGPAFDCFRSFAPNTDRMRIWIQDGFPHVVPKIFVEGMPGEHVAANGDVCLWTGTDESYAWRRLPQIEERAGEWVERQRAGFVGPDAVLDAHLYFQSYSPSKIAVFELDAVSSARDNIAHVSGSWNDNGNVLSIVAGTSYSTQGRCYSISAAPHAPPRTLVQFRAGLTSGQQNNFDRRLKAVKGGADTILMLSWSTGEDRNVVVLMLTPGAGDSIDATALEAAPTDRRFQLMRAGPDAGNLSVRKAVIFGLGAVGSHAALMLGASGFGHLRLVDRGTIRPGDKARHASGGLGEGKSKASTIGTFLCGRAPWTEVETINEAPWNPERVRELITDFDVVVELTGYGRFTDLLSLVAADVGVPFISGALHRRGALGRVRCQTSDKPLLAERLDETHYPVIPPDEEALPSFEPGCSEPVNNASPIRVQRLAGLVVDVVVDATLERNNPDEVVEVYNPIDIAPFDKRGRLEFPE